MTTLPPEPPIGCEVVDRHDVRWEHVAGTCGNHYWMHADASGDPESWVRVNEFGPLQLVWTVGDMQSGEVREELQPLAWADLSGWGL